MLNNKFSKIKISELMVHAENLYSAIGYEKLFAPSELLGKIGCRLSGHSSQKALFPLAWRLSSLGDERKAEMNLNPVSVAL